MAATRVQNVTNTATTTTTITIGSTQGWVAPTAGNLIVAWYNGDATVTTPTGFTAGPSVVDGNGVYFWYKVAAGTETTTTFTQAAASVGEAGLLEYSGMAATPFDVQNASPITTGSAGTTVPAVSVTATGTSGDLFLALAGLHGFGSASAPTAPTWTNGFTNIVALGAGTVNTASYSHAFVGEFQNTAAATVSTAASWTNTEQDRQEIVIAFKLAAGAAPVAPPPGILYIGPTRG
jgi:hypothetical protein